jgi:hypothetical protein
VTAATAPPGQAAPMRAPQPRQPATITTAPPLSPPEQARQAGPWPHGRHDGRDGFEDGHARAFPHTPGNRPLPRRDVVPGTAIASPPTTPPAPPAGTTIASPPTTMWAPAAGTAIASSPTTPWAPAAGTAVGSAPAAGTAIASPQAQPGASVLPGFAGQQGRAHRGDGGWGHGRRGQ